MVPSLKDAKDLKGKRVLLRADFNLPIIDGEVRDDFRLKKALPTIEFLIERGAEVIILSHHSDSSQTLHPVARRLNKEFPTYFVDDIYNKAEFTKAHDIDGRGKKHVIFCENLRKWPGEKGNDATFAKHLAALGDVYVNDAFSASHRKHASVVILPTLLPSYAGMLFGAEVEALSRAFTPEHPFLFILGGAKTATKLPLAVKFLPLADTVFIGGALANTFFKKMGHEIGRSVCEEMDKEVSLLLKSEKLALPTDVLVNNEDGVFTKKPNEVLPGDKILDAGPETVNSLKKGIRKAVFVLWNGPLGAYEEEGFAHTTETLIQTLADSDAYSVVGGGDTVAVISRMGLENKFGFLSTAGGAMLDFLAHRTLPGIEALKEQRL
ncbi:MAG: phosphoglycerate kinase [Parcubacteria group bacterium]|nr:phosphoglycerate kinase [Parcubacteria group bacterium]